MMAPPGAMCEMKVEGGGRNKELRKEEEDGILYATNGSLPPPPQDSCSPNVGDIDPGGAVNDRGVWKVWSGAGEAMLLMDRRGRRSAGRNGASSPPSAPFLFPPTGQRRPYALSLSVSTPVAPPRM